MLTLIVMAAVALNSAGGQLPVFRAVADVGDQRFLLDEDGRALYVSSAAQPPRIAAPLGDANGPVVWKRQPLSFAAWRDGWVFADGSDALTHFSRGGLHRGRMQLPTRASSVTVSGGRMWIYNFLPSATDARLWTSVDGIRFDRVPVPVVDESMPFAAKVLDVFLVMAAASRDRLVVVKGVGPPSMRFVRPDGKVEMTKLAYSRAAARDALTGFKKGVTDVTRYSSPASDLVAQDDQVIVLRNREDVRVNGVTQTVVGRRIDKYIKGRHVATAEFPETIRWILGADAGSVSGVTLSRTVIKAKWSAPQPSAIIE